MISTIKENIVPSATKKKCLTYKEELIELLRVNTECFYGFSKEELVKLFGKPSLEILTQFNYLFYPDCEVNSQANTFFYRLNFYFVCENQPTSNVTFCVVSREKVFKQ